MEEQAIYKVDSLGWVLKQKRIEKGISVRKLAKLCESITYSTITKIETGQTNNPNINTILELSKVLDFELDDIKKYY